MVTGVFLFIEISYMLLLSYPIKYFFKLVIRNTQNFFYHLLFPIGKSRKTKSDGREKRKAIFEAKTKCAQKSRLLPPSGQ